MFRPTLPARRTQQAATVPGMTHKLSPGTALLLTIPPLLWAGNAVVGRLMQGLVPPVTLNFLRWVLAFAILLPLAADREQVFEQSAAFLLSPVGADEHAN